MRTFWDWLEFLLDEARRPPIDPGVLAGYEHAFQDELRKLIRRTQDPALRRKFEEMLDCPVVDSRGNCHSFTGYAASALVRQGLHTRYDLEAALGYVFEKMLMPTTDAGEPRGTVFSGFDVDREYLAGTNPLQARFLAFLGNAVRTIRQGKVPRLASVEHRPRGTVSIGLGRRQEGDPAGSISPDEIAAPHAGGGDLGEMVGDIEALLRKKEPAYGFPLADLFRATMGGMKAEEQRKRFGDRPARAGRQIIIDTIRDYAARTGNQALLNMVQRFRDGGAGGAAQVRRTPARTPRPVLPEKERDYASIASVVARFDRPVGSSDLGKYRARWLEYPPRNAAGGHRNRLEEVLEAMVRDGVLKATRTTRGAVVYSPGPRFQESHRQGVGVG